MYNKNIDMFWKEFTKFIKPDWKKLLFFALTMGYLNYIWISSIYVCDGRILVGIPLGFYPIGSIYGGFLEPGEPIPIVEFSWINLILDIIFWYLVACAIFYGYGIIKKHKILLFTPFPVGIIFFAYGFNILMVNLFCKGQVIFTKADFQFSLLFLFFGLVAIGFGIHDFLKSK